MAGLIHFCPGPVAPLLRAFGHLCPPLRIVAGECDAQRLGVFDDGRKWVLRHCNAVPHADARVFVGHKQQVSGLGGRQPDVGRLSVSR